MFIFSSCFFANIFLTLTHLFFFTMIIIQLLFLCVRQTRSLLRFWETYIIECDTMLFRKYETKFLPLSPRSARKYEFIHLDSFYYRMGTFVVNRKRTYYWYKDVTKVVWRLTVLLRKFRTWIRWYNLGIEAKTLEITVCVIFIIFIHMLCLRKHYTLFVIYIQCWYESHGLYSIVIVKPSFMIVITVYCFGDRVYWKNGRCIIHSSKHRPHDE